MADDEFSKKETSFKQEVDIIQEKYIEYFKKSSNISFLYSTITIYEFNDVLNISFNSKYEIDDFIKAHCISAFNKVYFK